MSLTWRQIVIIPNIILKAEKTRMGVLDLILRTWTCSIFFKQYFFSISRMLIYKFCSVVKAGFINRG